MTLQVVLRGSDGVVIASDTCVASRPKDMNVTDSNFKMVIKPRFVCTFAGDDCAQSIATEIVAKVGDLGFENSTKFIEEVDLSLRKHEGGPGLFRQTQYRKILWIQILNGSEFAIWAASYCCGVNGPVFELIAPQVQDSIFAGDEGNPARYFVEHYYRKNPTKSVSRLKRLAAHVIRTGHIFNSACVNGLEMVVGENGGFLQVPLDELQKIDNEISGIHPAIDALFGD
jgi:hypothetical protein